MRTSTQRREWAPDDDDQPCPCGVNHTRGEHGYDPEAEAEAARAEDLVNQMDENDENTRCRYCGQILTPLGDGWVNGYDEPDCPDPAAQNGLANGQHRPEPEEEENVDEPDQEYLITETVVTRLRVPAGEDPERYWLDRVHLPESAVAKVTARTIAHNGDWS